MLKWKKLGKIFDPAEHKTEEWMTEYAQLPFPMPISEDILRVYFATRPKIGADKQYISHSGYVDLQRKDITKIVNISSTPIFELGGPGTFDEFGSMTSSFIKTGDKIYAYYTGWTRMTSVPYNMAVGLAISSDGGSTFEKYSNGPILGQTAQEPFLLTGPIVKIIDGKWHMWYLRGTKWFSHNGKYDPVYKIAHATSPDGINWIRNGIPMLPSKTEDECQVSFALFHFQGKWNVIFAYRQSTDFRENTSCGYRLGYAWSNDLEKWNRDDSKVGIDVSETGWDSEMQAYPQICQIDDRILLFYCGNNFGKGGFGAAELIK